MKASETLAVQKNLSRLPAIVFLEVYKSIALMLARSLACLAHGSLDRGDWLKSAFGGH
jgi:hypothetical protein